MKINAKKIVSHTKLMWPLVLVKGSKNKQKQKSGILDALFIVESLVPKHWHKENIQWIIVVWINEWMNGYVQSILH